MKSVVLLCSLIAVSTAAPSTPLELSLKDAAGKVCFMEQAIVMLEIMYEDKDNKTPTAMITLDKESGAKMATNGSACGVNMTTVAIEFPANDTKKTMNRLVVGFSREGVNVFFESTEFTYSLDSIMYFPDAKFDPKNPEKTSKNDSMHLDMGATDTFFSCPKTGLAMVDAEMKIGSEQLKVQAFGIMHDKYSDLEQKCGGPDPHPTPQPTIPSYNLKDAKNNTCIFAQLNIEVNVTYPAKGGSTKTVVLDFSRYATPVSGSCAGANDTTAQITITIPFGSKPTSSPEVYQVDDVDAERGHMFTLDFKNDKKEAVAVLSSINFDYMLNDTGLFPDAEFNASTVNQKASNASNQTLGEKNSPSYTCALEQDFALSGGSGAVAAVLSNIRLQPFDVEDNEFSKGYDCAAKPAPPRKAPDVPSVNEVAHTFNGSCILLDAAFQLEIQYTKNDSKNSTGTVKMNFPWKGITVESECKIVNSTAQTISLLSSGTDDNWARMSLHMMFDKKPDGDHVALTAVQLAYQYDMQFFHDAHGLGSGDTYRAENKATDGIGDFKWANDEYYKCAAKTDLTLTPPKGEANTHTVTLTTVNFKAEAFRTGDNAMKNEFANTEKDCATDLTNAIVPIAVGAALAALVVIVLIAYVIGRRRSRAGYETI